MKPSAHAVAALVAAAALLTGCSSSGGASASSVADQSSTPSRAAAADVGPDGGIRSVSINPVTDSSFQGDVLDASVPTAVLFTMALCNSCRSQVNYMAEATYTFVNGVNFVTLDADTNPEIARRYRIRGFPTTILFENGQVKATQVGSFLSSQALVRWIENSR